ncbi:MAG: RNA-binding S4 domain-containing protein [Clostridiales bacterium]|nr:RNA-binding S4 domain-containing protein [Clostridiales bacterium]
MKKEIVSISTPFIRLDALLKLAGIAATGGEAKMMIQTGQIQVDGESCLQRGRKIRSGQIVIDPEGKREITVREISS